MASAKLHPACPDKPRSYGDSTPSWRYRGRIPSRLARFRHATARGCSAMDAFISHASEDRETVAKPLADLLLHMGFEIWIDQYQLKLGDSLRRQIDKALVECRFGVVVLSPAFFAKEWPIKELDGLIARETCGDKVVIPVWHQLDVDQILKFSPVLADKFAAHTSAGLRIVAERIAEVLVARSPARGRYRASKSIDYPFALTPVAGGGCTL
jgi:hypothetical protein